MAEYDMYEVVRQAKRACENGGQCESSCPLNPYIAEICTALCSAKLPEAIEKVMQWAKDNPEPKYPSWDDAWKQLWPEAVVTPCPSRCFGAPCIGNAGCDTCREQPIPADVAQRLGIEPIMDGGEAGV